MPVYDSCNRFGIEQVTNCFPCLALNAVFPNSYAAAPGIEPTSLESSNVAPWPGTFEGRFADWATARRQNSPFLSDKKLWSDWKTQKATILQHLKRYVKTLCQMEACFEPARIRTNHLQHKRRPVLLRSWRQYRIGAAMKRLAVALVGIFLYAYPNLYLKLSNTFKLISNLVQLLW